MYYYKDFKVRSIIFYSITLYKFKIVHKRLLNVFTGVNTDIRRPFFSIFLLYILHIHTQYLHILHSDAVKNNY